MECIYYKDKEGLEWKGQEHIFQASLGEIKKLPVDYVSKDANDYFSKLENHLTLTDRPKQTRCHVFWHQKSGYAAGHPCQSAYCGKITYKEYVHNNKH